MEFFQISKEEKNLWEEDRESNKFGNNWPRRTRAGALSKIG